MGGIMSNEDYLFDSAGRELAEDQLRTVSTAVKGGDMRPLSLLALLP